MNIQHVENSNLGSQNPRNIQKGHSAFTITKEWFIDFFSFIIKPRTATFTKASTRADDKSIIAIFIMLIMRGIILIELIAFGAIKNISIYTILNTIFWQPLTVVVILITVYWTIHKGFDSSKPSFSQMLYCSSLLYVFFSLFYVILILGDGLRSGISNGYILFNISYHFLFIIGLAYTTILCYLCGRNVLLKILWSRFELILLFSLAFLVSFGIAYYLNRILQGSLHLDQWDLIIGLLLSGSLLGFFQAIVFRRTPISPIRWFLATIIGSIIGACIYFLLFNASLSDAIVSWETYTINQATVINGNLLGIQSEQLRRLFLAFENIVLSGGFIIPIGIVQWIILRKWAKNSFLWVIILFLTYESSILNGSGGLALFVRWFVPGITLVCLISPFLIDHGASKESVRIPEH